MCTAIRFSDGQGNMYLGRNLDWSVGYGQIVLMEDVEERMRGLQSIMKAQTGKIYKRLRRDCRSCLVGGDRRTV